MGKELKIGDIVTVYDSYRFTVPLRATIKGFSHWTDGVEVTLLQTSHAYYPIGMSVWVHQKQLELVTKFCPGPGGIGID